MDRQRQRKGLCDMELLTISDLIFRLPASDSPLSADVGIVRGDRFDWLFDIGGSEEAAYAIQKNCRERIVVLSHFHADHAANLSRVPHRALYCGGYTARRLREGTAVQGPLCFKDGVRLKVFPLPSVHSKGSVGLLVNEEYAFLGDAVYGAPKAGRTAYNVSALRELILALENIPAPYFFISHDPVFVHPKETVVSTLKNLYERRAQNESFLFLK